MRLTDPGRGEVLQHRAPQPSSAHHEHMAPLQLRLACANGAPTPRSAACPSASPSPPLYQNPFSLRSIRPELTLKPNRRQDHLPPVPSVLLLRERVPRRVALGPLGALLPESGLESGEIPLELEDLLARGLELGALLKEDL